MLMSKFSGVTLASLMAIGSLCLLADEAAAGQSIGSCSLKDVSLFSSSVGATKCGNFEGNDDTHGLEAFGQTWTFLGKDEDNTVSLTDKDGKPLSGDDIKKGYWSFDGDLKDYADSLVVVLKASTFYSAYLFEDLAQYTEAVNEGTFSVAGVTNKGKAGLSHMSIYYAPRLKEVDPPKIPEPAMVIGLLTVVGVGSRLKKAKTV